MYIASKNSNNHLRTFRVVRDKLLAATDFYYLSDTPDVPPGVPEYRQALRDCTNPPPGQQATLPDPASFGLPPKLVEKLSRIRVLDIEGQFG